MLRALYIDRVRRDIRSNGDREKRVDAYFVMFSYPRPPSPWSHAYRIVYRFEVPRGAPFQMQDFETIAAVEAAQGFTQR